MPKNDFPSEIVFSDNFKAILSFFQFECPVKDVSQRGTEFEELGWKGSSRFQMLERIMKESSFIEENNWIICDKSEIAKKINTIKPNKNYVVCNKEKGKIQSVIYAIRNSFAHGGFDVLIMDGETTYHFVNHHNGHIKADMLIQEKVLLSWIKIIKTKPEYQTKAYKKQQEKNKKESKKSGTTNRR